MLRSVERASLQQGRDNRLASYNDYRERMSYPRVARFEQISEDPEVVAALKLGLYEDVDRIEFFVGLFAEDPPDRSAVPPLIGRMVAVERSRTPSPTRYSHRTSSRRRRSRRQAGPRSPRPPPCASSRIAICRTARRACASPWTNRRTPRSRDPRQDPSAAILAAPALLAEAHLLGELRAGRGVVRRNHRIIARSAHLSRYCSGVML